MPDDNSLPIVVPISETDAPPYNVDNGKTAMPSDRLNFKQSIQKQMRDFKIEMRHAWKNKDLKKLWNYAVHCIGFVSYTVVSVVLALFLWVAAFFLTIGNRDKQNDDSSYMAMVGFVFKILEVIFMTFFQIFAGIMGWGAYNTKPSQVPWRILGSISKKVKPSTTTQFFGYGTIGLAGFQTLQIIFS